MIVRDFCDHLGSFARNAEGRSKGMMYTAVIHAPGPGNDRRNYHLHVIAHDRPATWMPDLGKWDFEVAEEFRRKGEIRVRYPHRQDKIIEVSRSLAPDKRPEHHNAAIAGKAFVPHLRERFADICNERLALRGIRRRIDARSHKALGIERSPNCTSAPAPPHWKGRASRPASEATMPRSVGAMRPKPSGGGPKTMSARGTARTPS